MYASPNSPVVADNFQKMCKFAKKLTGNIRPLVLAFVPSTSISLTPAKLSCRDPCLRHPWKYAFYCRKSCSTAVVVY